MAELRRGHSSAQSTLDVRKDQVQQLEKAEQLLEMLCRKIPFPKGAGGGMYQQKSDGIGDRVVTGQSRSPPSASRWSCRQKKRQTSNRGRLTGSTGTAGPSGNPIPRSLSSLPGWAAGVRTTFWELLQIISALCPGLTRRSKECWGFLESPTRILTVVLHTMVSGECVAAKATSCSCLSLPPCQRGS